MIAKFFILMRYLSNCLLETKDAIALKPEEEARKKIDSLLELAGWLLQDYKDVNLGAGLGVAIREFSLKGAGFADYLLFVERHAVGVIEAKRKAPL